MGCSSRRPQPRSPRLRQPPLRSIKCVCRFVCVCVYIYIYIHMYIYIYIHMYIHVTHKHVYISFSLSLYIYIYVYIHICIHICIHMHIYIYIYMYVCTFILYQLTGSTPNLPTKIIPTSTKIPNSKLPGDSLWT